MHVSVTVFTTALTRVAELLDAECETFAIVVLGGAALNLLGVVDRVTRDVDIIAFGIPADARPPRDIVPPTDPLPAALRRAADIVGRDLRLPADWLNAESALQWSQGLPPGLADRITWRHYGTGATGLWVGLVDPYDLTFFKLFAAVDDATTRSRHYRDLLALSPDSATLAAATDWVRGQDASPEFADVLDRMVTHLRRELAHG